VRITRNTQIHRVRYIQLERVVHIITTLLYRKVLFSGPWGGGDSLFGAPVTTGLLAPTQDDRWMWSSWMKIGKGKRSIQRELTPGAILSATYPK
jgi:hypothetical protein